jgi:F-type H+-transporting ATPase subunit epsilon
METLRLEIVTPLGPIYDGDVTEVTLPGSEGEFGVLPGHAALVSLLRAGVIDFVTSDGSKELVAVNWGHVKVEEDSVAILAEGAVSISGDNDSKIAAAIDEAKELLQIATDSNILLAAAEARIEATAKGKI